MKNWSKKIASVVLAALFIGFSSGHCGEINLDSQELGVSNAVRPPLYNKDSEKNFLFDFMRISQHLFVVEEWKRLMNSGQQILGMRGLLYFRSKNPILSNVRRSNDAENQDSKNNEDDTLPFRNLFHRLERRLAMLAQAERKLAASKEDPKMVNLKLKFAAMSFPTTKEQLNQNLEKIFEYRKIGYENLCDGQSLFVALSYDFNHLNEILKDLNDGQKKELLSKVHAYLLTKYEKFIAKSEAILRRTEKIANDEFIIKVQECVDYEGERLCVGDTAGRSIKTLSELEQEAKVQEILDYFEIENLEEAFSEMKDSVKEDYPEVAFSEVKDGVKETYSEVESIHKTIIQELSDKVFNHDLCKKPFKKKK